MWRENYKVTWKSSCLANLPSSSYAFLINNLTLSSSLRLTPSLTKSNGENLQQCWQQPPLHMQHQTSHFSFPGASQSIYKQDIRQNNESCRGRLELGLLGRQVGLNFLRCGCPFPYINMCLGQIVYYRCKK